MRDHPCLSCILPDCDERSKACALRLAAKSGMAKREAGLPLTEREQIACAEPRLVARMEFRVREKARQGKAQGTQEHSHA